jgi:hypothetical protein
MNDLGGEGDREGEGGRGEGVQIGMIKVYNMTRTIIIIMKLVTVIYYIVL